MYARQLGFLHSRPKGDDESRGQALERTGQPHELPDLEDYLISDFLEIGPSQPTMGGDGPISDQSLWFFSQNTEIHHDRYERKALIDMSRAYCFARNDGAEIGAIAPVHQTDSPKRDQAVAIARGFGSVLRTAAKGGAQDG